MHSLGQRRRAVELYIKYGLKATATIRELGYPSRAQLVSWHREWQENGGRLTDRSLEQHALDVFANVGVDGTLSRFSTLRSWAC